MEYLGQYQDIDLVNHGLKIGDTVHIVEDPYMLCPFSWTSYMTCYCGKETVITDIKIKPDGRPDSFRIAVDGGGFIWSAGCFQEVRDAFHAEIIPADNLEISDLFDCVECSEC